MSGCDDCGHTYKEHHGSTCWGRVQFDNGTDDGPLCNCTAYVECDCGCRDAKEATA